MPGNNNSLYCTFLPGVWTMMLLQIFEKECRIKQISCWGNVCITPWKKLTWATLALQELCWSSDHKATKFTWIFLDSPFLILEGWFLSLNVISLLKRIRLMQSVFVMGVSQTSLGTWNPHKGRRQVAEDTERQSEWIIFFPRLDWREELLLISFLHHSHTPSSSSCL